MWMDNYVGISLMPEKTITKLHDEIIKIEKDIAKISHLYEISVSDIKEELFKLTRDTSMDMERAVCYYESVLRKGRED